MKKYNNLIQCGIQNNCINDIIFIVLSFNKTKNDVVRLINNGKMVPLPLQNKFKTIYKNFSKTFFSKKTSKCLLENCRSKFPNISKDLEFSKRKIEKIRENLSKKAKNDLISNYIKVLKIMEYIIKDFTKKYDKHYKIHL